MPPVLRQRLPNELQIQFMKFCKMELPNVSSMLINISTGYGPKFDGIRHFNKTRMPSVKYHNPDIVVTPIVNRTKPVPSPTIDILFKDGTKATVATENLDSADIWDKVVVAGKGKDLTPKRPITPLK